MNDKVTQQAARKAKLAKALKANVKRRKAAVVPTQKQPAPAVKE